MPQSCRLAHAGAYSPLLDRSDFGVSAAEAAWVGLIAGTHWCRASRRPGVRGAIVGACALTGLVAWLVRPDLTLLDADHAVAFAVGIATALRPALRAPALLRPPARATRDA